MGEMLTRVNTVCVPACVRAFVCVCLCACVCLCDCDCGSFYLCFQSCFVVLDSICYFFCLFIRCQYYNGNKMLPVFKQSTSKEHYSIETLAKLLLDTDSTVATGKREVCCTQQVQVPFLIGESLSCHLN